MVKCPFCEQEIKRHIHGVEIQSEKEQSVTLSYDEVLVCATHGAFTRRIHYKEVEL